jgi:endogenous inhibitor of DNA gyrase (YacG/DUF329 family)
MTDATDDPARKAAAPAAAAAGTGKACPICGGTAEPRFRPFCSRRCADLDLSRWLHGVYRVPVNDPEAEIEDGDAGAGPDPR